MPFQELKDLEELIQFLIELKKIELKSEHPTDAAKRILEFLGYDALLARLEAAEACLGDVWATSVDSERWEAWRKARK